MYCKKYIFFQKCHFLKWHFKLILPYVLLRKRYLLKMTSIKVSLIKVSLTKVSLYEVLPYTSILKVVLVQKWNDALVFWYKNEMSGTEMSRNAAKMLRYQNTNKPPAFFTRVWEGSVLYDVPFDQNLPL